MQITSMTTTFVVEDWPKSIVVQSGQFDDRSGSSWKRLILAAKVCRNNGNVAGALQLYRRGLQDARSSGIKEDNEDVITFLTDNLWT